LEHKVVAARFDFRQKEKGGFSTISWHLSELTYKDGVGVDGTKTAALFAGLDIPGEHSVRLNIRRIWKDYRICRYIPNVTKQYN
jgi:hypothetical protein